MIELQGDALVFSFPEVHEAAVLRIAFQRTLRIPDDGREYPLPPGLGRFPLRHVDDFGAHVPEKWLQRGGVMTPMYQSEAMWLSFSSPDDYPFAVKVAAGKVNAVTGDDWSDHLTRRPQDYLSVPSQPWLDGFCVAKDVIRQFVAMPLGAGYTAEEQISGSAEYGGIQLLVHPLKATAYRPRAMEFDGIMACEASVAYSPLGLAPGGRMKQQIYRDPQRFADWDTTHRARCFVHLANSMVWRSITGAEPPTVPPTAAEYTDAGLPWFEYYAADREVLQGGSRLAGLQSVAQKGTSRGDVPLPENESVDPSNVVSLRTGLGPGRVREESF